MKRWYLKITMAVLLMSIAGMTTALGLSSQDLSIKAEYGSDSIWWNDLIISITNKGSSSIDGWTVEFDFPYVVNNFDNVVLESNTNNHYKISNAGWGEGMSLSPGDTLSFKGGFSLNGSEASQSKLPKNFILNGIPVGDNSPPIISFNSPSNNQTITQKTLSPISVSVKASDPDGSVQSVKIEVDNKIFNGSNVSWTPSKFGSFNINGIVTDNEGAIASKIISIVVKQEIPNAPPTVKITNHSNGAIIEQLSLSPISISIDAKDSDGIIASQSITVDGETYNGSSASFTPSKFGTFTIVANATDDKGATASDTVQITVNQKVIPNVNPTVSFVQPTDGQIFLQQTLSPIDIKIAAYDSDGTIAQKLITVEGKSYNSDEVTFTPSIFGTFVILAQVIDDDGASAEKSIQITVEESNIPAAPVANNDSVTTDMNKSISIFVLVNDTGDGIEIESATPPSNGTSFAFGNQVIYTPAEGFNGNDSLTYTIKDSRGRKATGTITIIVNAPFDPTGKSFTFGDVTISFKVYPEDSAWHGIYYMTGTVTGAESGWDMTLNYPNNQTLIYAMGVAQLSNEGGNKLNNYGGSGSGSFELYIIGAPANVLPSNVSFNGSGPVNNPPVAENDSATVESGKSITINVLSNDSDPDGDTINISKIASPSMGIALISGNSITYTANSDVDGTDTFTYTISDGKGGEDTATVNVEVTKPELNKLPTVLITAPQNNQEIIQINLSAVTITIKTEDADGTVDAIIIEVDGQKFENQTTASWVPTKFGSHQIIVKVVDNDGGAAIAMAVVVIVKGDEPVVKKQIIGYINQWDQWKRNDAESPFEIEQGSLNQTNIAWDKYTMINFSFFGVAQDGSLHSGDFRNKQMKSTDASDYVESEVQVPAELVNSDEWSYDDYLLSGKDGFKSIFELGRENNVKVMAAIGGWSMCGHFAEVAADPQKRAVFINACQELINMGFDGIDLDWEYPGHQGMNIRNYSDADYQNYTVLLKELREAIGPDKLLTSAINCLPEKIEKIEWIEIDKYLDYYNMMTYDVDGGWSDKAGHNSPLYSWKDAGAEQDGSWDRTFNYLTKEKGIDPAKINLGMSFYGRAVITDGPGGLLVNTQKSEREFHVDGLLNMAHDWDNFPKWEGTPYYYYIDQKTSGWTEHWDDVAKVPYKTKGNHFLSYDNEQSIELKAKYVVNKSAGGVIVWNAFGDLDFRNATATKNGNVRPFVTYSGVKNPLIDVVYNVFQNGGSNIEPTVKITKPSDNQIIKGNVPPSVTIEGSAYDADGTVSSLKLTVEGQSYNLNLSDGKFSYNWTPSAFGSYEIKAEVTDNEGAVSVNAVSVTVRDENIVIPERQIIGYINQWDGWKADERGVPHKGALNHTNIDWDKYTMVNFAFFGVANDGSLHSGDYRSKQIHLDGTVQEPAPMINTDKYSSFDPYFFIGDVEELWWVGADKVALLEELGIEWNNDTQTWTNTKTGESGIYPITVPKAGGQPTMFEVAQEKNVKLMASIGGWSMCRHFPETAANPTMRAKFIEDCMTLIDMGFDGIDIDWEYPGQKGMNIEGYSDDDYHNYTVLLKELREALGPDKLLTSAINCMPSQIEKIEWSEVDRYLDYYNMMTYDIDGGWSDNAGHNSPLYDWKDASVTDNNVSWDKTFKYLTEDIGIDPSKINMGMAFYGRSVQTKTPGALGAETKKSYQIFYVDGSLLMAHDFVNFKEWEGTPYNFYIENNTSSWTEHWDDVAKVPYKTMGNFFLSYDNSESIELKAKYVVDNNAGGVIIWNAFADLNMSNANITVDHVKIPTLSNISHPLIDSVYNVFKNYIPEPVNNTPTVEIISHSNNDIIDMANLSSVTLRIKAEDSDGSIVSSSISVDGKTYNGTTANWTPSTFGSFTIIASATDNNNKTVSDAIVVIINKVGSNVPPVVSFASPTNGSVFQMPLSGTVNISLSSSDGDGQVVSHTITVDGKTYNSKDAAWSPSKFGIFNIYAVATDNDGSSATANISVTIQQIQNQGSSPELNIISPSDNQTIELDSLSVVQINIDANDVDGDLDEVTISVDGKIFNGINASWTPTSFGSFDVTASASDLKGNVSTAVITVIIKQKSLNDGKIVRGWPDYIAMGAVTLTQKNAHTGRPVDAVFKYAGDGGNGDRGRINYPIYTKNCAIMCEDLEAEYGMDVMPVMVVYTCEMSGGSNTYDLHDFDNLTMHFINLIQTTQILQSFKSASNPYPGSYVMNPDMLGMVRQNNLLSMINAEPIKVQQALYKALHFVYDKFEYKGMQLNPMEIFDFERASQWSDWDFKYGWEQLVLTDIYPVTSEEPIQGTPQFENNLKGWIQATNYIIKRFGPDITFGWQENLWSPGSSLWIHDGHSDDYIKNNIAQGTVDLWNDLEVYTGTYKPDFLVFDKYEMDVLYTSSWLFNDTDWESYLSYVKNISKGLGDQPVMLWQLPGGHIQKVGDVDTRTDHGATAPNYFLGDPNLASDLSNAASHVDQGVRNYLNSNGYDWSNSNQMQQAKDCNVFSMLWGGGNTTSVGTFPYNDGGWLSSRINSYYLNPTYLK